MVFSDFVHPESDPVEPRYASNHVALIWLQWKNPNMEVMLQAANQTFAMIYGLRSPSLSLRLWSGHTGWLRCPL